MPNQSRTITDPGTEEFVLLAKTRGSTVWRQFVPEDAEGVIAKELAAQMLQNWMVDYVEWTTGSRAFRVVRRGNVGAYRVE